MRYSNVPAVAAQMNRRAEKQRRKERHMEREIKLALLGDKAAQERLTEAGVLLPCWRCGGEAEVQDIHTGGKPLYAVSCKKHYCGAYGCAHRAERDAVAYWNNRAPILSAEEMEMLNERSV